MRKKFTRLLFLALMIGSLLGLTFLDSYGQEYKNGVLQGAIRVKLKPTIGSAIKLSKSAQGVVKTGIQTLDNLNSTYAITEMKRVFPYSPKFEDKHKKYGLDLWYELTISSKSQVSEVVSAFSRASEISKAEPILEAVLIDGSGEPIYLPKSDAKKSNEYYNDPYLPKQWHYNNTGQTGGTPGADINAYSAWDITKGSKNVIVSIHDQGVDVKHEDLKDAMWVNIAELNGVKGLDDDGNGYKDDIYGFNFANNRGDVDAQPHGTHVAGTVGAVNNNGVGVAGVAGGSGSADGVRIMSCQVLGGTSSGNTPDSYIYAADMGAVISQNSWGYSSPEYFEQAVLDAIDYFIAEAGSYAGSPMKGGVVIFASGNSSWEYKSYPAFHPSCIAVSALNASNHLTVYSNYGDWVDISAPGGQSEDNVEDSPYKNGVLSTLNNNAYGYMDGTSMACPHVSGVAALVVSKYGNTNFTSAELKNRLLTGTRFLDTIQYNVQYNGKLGKGAIDAVLALAVNNGVAPNKINDLNLTGIAQDFANLKWTVPADNDDVKPTSFEVIYSDTLITDELFKYAKTIKFEKPIDIGSPDSIEIKNLKPLTKYYFAIRTYDRWGNRSEYSNIISGKTNAGPDAELDADVTALNINIDVTANNTGVGIFNLNNIGEGTLKWSAVVRHKSAQPTSVVNNRNLSPVPSHKPKIYSARVNKVSKAEPFAIDKPTYDWIDYVYGINMWALGDVDTTITNSSATRFYVAKEGGFNLTKLSAFLRNKTSEPIVLEIYQGIDINSAQIVYTQDITYTNYYDYTGITLNEQIFFENGAYFWVVFHAPALNKYPLGAGIESSKDLSKNCFYSSDKGKTWQLFEDVYYDNQLVWAVAAYSMYANIGEYITLSPEQGVVEPNNLSAINASVDAANMINGNYRANIVVNTNEPNQPMLRLPVNLNITGHKPVLQSIRRTDVGAVLIGSEKEFEISIKNNGLGRFDFDMYGYDDNYNPIYLNISNPQFTYISGVSSIFDAKTEIKVKLKFKPLTVGNVPAVVSIKDKNGNTYSFDVVGVGVEPPRIEISPADTTVTSLNIGDEITGRFFIKNTGKYPLDYFVPSFADGSNMVEMPKNIHRFGYVTSLNPGGLNPTPVFDWVDISATGTDISGQLKYDQDFYPVELGFEFPFFGKNETKAFVSNYGTLSFDTEGYIWSATPLNYQWEGLPDRIISALGIRTIANNSGKIYYQAFSDRFIVQWSNIPIFYEGAATASFQIVLHENGNININIDNITLIDPWLSIEIIQRLIYIAIEDQTKSDGILIYDSESPNLDVLNNSSTILFENPGLSLFTSVINPFGTVQPGDSVKMEYSIATGTLYEKSYKERLVVISNDPVSNPALFSASFNVTGGGNPDLKASTGQLDFGKVFQGDVVVEQIILMNKGNATTNVTAADLKYGYFELDRNIVQAIKPGRSLSFGCKPNTLDLADLKDTLTISTSEGKTFQVELLANIVNAPSISLSLTEVAEVIESGTTKSVLLTVNNTGKADLNIAPIGCSWLSVTPKQTKRVPEIPDFTYRYSSSENIGGPQFSWLEIGEKGNKLPMGDPYNGEEPWVKVALPYAFNFYGVDYSDLYVGFNGIISFSPDQVIAPWGMDPIPNVAMPNNFIAPLYGMAGPDNPDFYPNSGHYLKVFDDKIIVEFKDFNVYGISEPMSIQAILYKNGTIKFQYKLVDGETMDLISGFGVIGVENLEGTDGVQISFFEEKNRDKMAYQFVPVKKYVVPANSSVDFDINIDAKTLYAGSYTANIDMMNNAPLGQDLIIPVALEVTGTPIIEYNTKVEMGEMIVTEVVGEWGSEFKNYTNEFEITNSGTAKVEILQFDLAELLNSTVEAYTLTQDWFGNMTYQWVDVANLPLFDWDTWSPIPLYIEPKSSIKLRVNYTPLDAIVIADTLNIVTDLEPLSIAISGTSYLPPVVSLNPEEIRIYAPEKSYTDTIRVVIDNLLGGYGLNYTLSLDYLRGDLSNTSSVYSYAQELNSIPALQYRNVTTKSKGNKASKETFNRVMSYENVTSAESNLGYGGSYPFYTGTSFKAPDNGFNLTHVQTWYTPGDWLKSKIKVQIYAGNTNIFYAKLVHEQTFDYVIENVDNSGQLITIPLDKNLIFYPNETFFVVFGYESGAFYPQGVTTMSSVVTSRYLFSSGTGVWYDLSEVAAPLNSMGWIVRALEKDYQSSTWVSLSSSASGEITPGESGEIVLNFNAAYANAGENTAKLLVKSNDPVNPSKIVNLILDLNEGPEFDIAKTTISMKESETLEFAISAKDKEGDGFTLSMKSAPSFVSNAVNANSISVTCAPGFSDAGMYSLVAEATDSYGNKNEVTFFLTVENINRAPVVINPIGNTGMASTDISNILLTSVISDPDGDVLNYTVVSSNDNVVKVYMANDAVMFTTMSAGTTKITITATDAGGLSVSHSFNISVWPTSVEDNLNEMVKVYPNPTNSNSYVFVPSAEKGAKIRVLDVIGSVLYECIAKEERTTIDFSCYSDGIYFIQVHGSKVDKSIKVVKH